MKVLEDNGYKFENRAELEEFARTRCELIRFTSSPKRILVVDGKQLCMWWETSRYEKEANKVTCIIGEPPVSCDHACSPSDYYKGGKCDKMRCYDNKEDEFDEEDDFQCCDKCDLPDACSDFGCAIKTGVRKETEW